MSKLSSISREWPRNFLFPADKVPSNGSELEERQKLATFISDIGIQLCISSHCIYTAIVYMHRFLTIQPPARFYSLRICQAAIFLACKSNENMQSAKNVYKCTAKALKTPVSELPSVIDFHKNAILDYENLLFSTLGFGISVHHPHECIIEIIGKIRDETRSLPSKLLDELTKIACYIEKQSMLLTPFCVRYSADLIACFCIQLSIEIKNDEIKPMDWMNKRFTSEQIQNLINEFSVVYIKCSNIYKRIFTNEEDKLYKILREKALFYVDRLERKPVSPALIKEGGFVHPLSSSLNTDEQKSSIPPPFLSTTLSSAYTFVDLYQHIEDGTSLTNQISTKSEQTDSNNGNKRRYDSTNDDTTCKRPSQQQRKE